MEAFFEQTVSWDILSLVVDHVMWKGLWARNAIDFVCNQKIGRSLVELSEMALMASRQLTR